MGLNKGRDRAIAIVLAATMVASGSALAAEAPPAAAAAETAPGPPPPFHGYYYKMLTSYGSDAPGGVQDYIADDKMTRGSAFLAYPAEYRDSGVMTFMINKDGVPVGKDRARHHRFQFRSDLLGAGRGGLGALTMATLPESRKPRHTFLDDRRVARP